MTQLRPQSPAERVKCVSDDGLVSRLLSDLVEREPSLSAVINRNALGRHAVEPEYDVPPPRLDRRSLVSRRRRIDPQEEPVPRAAAPAAQPPRRWDSLPPDVNRGWIIGGTAVAGGNGNIPGIWGASLFIFLVVSMLNTNRRVRAFDSS